MFIYSKDELIVLPLILLGMFLFSFLLRYLLKDKSRIIRTYPFKIITIIVLVLEIIKQVLNIIDGFSTWAIPLHYCSLFVFFFPLAQFGNEKVKNFMKPVAVITALVMAVGFYSAPSLIIGDSTSNVMEDFSTFHTFTFHHLAIFYAILSIFLGDYTPNKTDYKNLAIVMLIYFAIAIPISFILDTNYCNILETTIPLIEPIQAYVGQFLYIVGLVIVIVGGTVICSLIYHSIYKLIKKK